MKVELREAGKSILVEKPPSTSTRGAGTIADATGYLASAAAAAFVLNLTNASRRVLLSGPITLAGGE